MVKKYFSISIAKHGENRVVKDRKKWSKIGGSSVVVLPFFARDACHSWTSSVAFLPFFLAVLHFGAIFSCVEKTPFWTVFDVIVMERYFHQLSLVTTINAKFLIKKKGSTCQDNSKKAGAVARGDELAGTLVSPDAWRGWWAHCT